MTQSNPLKQSALTARIRAHEAASDRPLAVSLEEFFDGNADYGSIGCNLSEHPGPQRFFEVLRQLRSFNGIQDVVVELHGSEDESSWLFSELVHVVGGVAREEIADAVAEFQPDQVTAEPFSPRPSGLPDPASGDSVVTLWWD